MLGSGVHSTRSYNPLRGWLDSAAATDTAGALVESTSYGFFDNGAVHRRKNRHTAVHECFAYDENGRLKQSYFDSDPSCDGAQPQQPVDYHYDDVGNFTSRSDVGTYTYDASHPSQMLGAGQNEYSYDANGRQVTRSGPDVAGQAQTIQYTAFNKVQLVTEADSSTTEFAYDADQERVFRRVKQANSDSDETRFLGELYERTVHRRFADGAETATHAYRIYAGGRQVAEVQQDSSTTTKHFILADELGSSTVVVDQSGAVVEEHGYTAFGRTRGGDWTQGPGGSAASVKTGFTGHADEAALGLINMRGRVYDPVAGRFITPDPVGFSGTQGLNRYAYVFNNPLNLVDPSGFIGEVESAPAGLAPQGAADSALYPFTTPGGINLPGGESPRREKTTATVGQQSTTDGGGMGGADPSRSQGGGVADVSAGVATTDGTGTSSVSIGGGAQRHEDATYSQHQLADAISATLATVEGFGKGAAASVAFTVGVSAIAAIPVVGQAIAVTAVTGFVIAGVYQLATGGAKGIYDSVNRVAHGQGTVNDFETIGVIVGLIALGGEGAGASAEGEILFGQKAISRTFTSEEAGSTFEFAGDSIAEVAAGLRRGEISPDQIPVGVVNIDGELVAVNNRSLAALKRAGMSPTRVIDHSANPAVVTKVLNRLSEMGGAPSKTIRIRGAGSNASAIF